MSDLESAFTITTLSMITAVQMVTDVLKRACYSTYFYSVAWSMTQSDCYSMVYGTSYSTSKSTKQQHALHVTID